MNKSELISAMAAETGVSQKDAGACIDAMFGAIAGAVRGGGKVSIPGWISFEQVDRAAREGRNPATGAAMHIPASKAVKVKAGSKLKAAGKGA